MSNRIITFFVTLAAAIAALFSRNAQTTTETTASSSSPDATTASADTEEETTTEEDPITVEPGNATITGIWTGKAGDNNPQTSISVPQGFKNLFVGALGTDEGRVVVGTFINGILIVEKSYDVQESNLGKLTPIVVAWPGEEKGTYQVTVKTGNMSDLTNVESSTNPVVWETSYGPFTVEVT